MTCCALKLTCFVLTVYNIQYNIIIFYAKSTIICMLQDRANLTSVKKQYINKYKSKEINDSIEG